MKRVLLSAGLIILIGQFAVGQNPFRTKQSGNWNDSNTWEEDTGGGFVATLNTPTSASGTITIRNSHTVTVTTGVTIDETTVQSGGAIVVNSGNTLMLDENFTSSPLTISAGGSLTNNGTLDLSSFLIISSCDVDGSITNSGTISISDNSLLQFRSGSNYFHNFASGGAIPTATWDANSTCEINNLSNSSPAVPTNLNQSFGNFRWNTPAMGATTTFSLGGQLTSISGNLTFLTSNTKAIRLNSGGPGYTLNIGGNFDNQGAPIILADNLSSPVVINVTGSYTQSQPTSSVPSFIFFTNNNSNDATINITGNFSRTAGTISRGSASSTSVQSTFNFIGSGVQTYSYSGSGVISTQIGYTVSASSTLDLGTSSLTGTGSLTLNGTLRVGSTDASGAIQTGTTNGNIRLSGTRTYSGSSTIIYNGLAAQFMGNGHPSNVNTQINNASGVSQVSDVTVGGNLTLTSGNLTIGSNTLTLNGNFTPNSNNLVVSSSSSLSIGGSGAFGNLSISGGPTINNFTLNRSSGSVTLVSNLTIGGTFTQTNGDINLNGNTLTISGAYSRASGNLAGTSSSSIVINGAGSLPSSIGISGGALGTFTMNRASTTLVSSSAFTVSNLNLLSGTFQNDGTVTMASGGAVVTRDVGALSGAGTIAAASSYDVVYNNSSVSPQTTGAELPTGTSQLRNLTINSTGQINLNSAITVNGTLTFTNGVFNAGSNTMDIKGNLVSNNTSQLTNSSITFSGNTTVSGSTQVIFGNITVTGTLTPTSALAINGNLVNNGTLNSGSGTVTFGGSTAISGSSVCSFNNVIISASSTLTAPSSMNVSGTWTNNGTFTNNGGTVTFNGTSSIAGSSTTNFGGVTIASSSSLTAPATMNVARDFTNNGTFTAGSGTLVLNGTSTQSIAGSTTTNFNNITVTNTAGPPAVQVQSNQNLSGILTLSSNSIFDADGSSNTSVFTLRSTGDSPTSDAAIATLPSGASVTGNVTVQRYMAIEGANSGRIYRYISSPVQSTSVSQLQNFIPVTGGFTGASSCSGCGTAQSMFSFDEALISGALSTGYQNFPVASNSETLTAGQGYAIFVRGNIAPVSSAGNALWAVSGVINSGSINFNSFTKFQSGNGWNLVGNPFPSTIDWDAASGWTKTGLNNTIYLLDNGLSTPVYATYTTGSGVNGGSRYIATGQAFFVRTTSSSINFLADENVKVAGTQTTFFRTETPSNELRLTLSKGNVKDEAVIRLKNGSTQNFDSSLDAIKLKNGTDTNPIISLSSFSKDNQALAINSIGTSLCAGSSAKSTLINLNIDGATPGAHLLSFDQFDTFQEDVTFVLRDLYTKDSMVVNNSNNKYPFSVTADPKTWGNARFALACNCNGRITAINEELENVVKIFPNPTDSKIQILVPAEINAKVSVFNNIGAWLGDVDLQKEGSMLKGLFDLEGQSSGLYFVRMLSGEKIISKKVIKK